MLMKSRFTVPQIAGLIGVSVRTIYWRIHQYGLLIQATCTELTNDELDVIVSRIRREISYVIYSKQMNGHYLSWGIRIQQHRIRECI